VGEKVFGSVSEVVLASQVAPTLLFGPQYRASGGSDAPTLLVAVDETEESEVVLSTAVLWAATFGGASRLVEVVGPSTGDQDHRHVGDRMARRIHDLAPDATCDIVDGHRPASALLSYGHRLDDVVMAMASGHWTEERAHLHSVARAVTHRSHFPVLVVPKVLAGSGYESHVTNGDAANAWQQHRH
jgi:nucleotide-binding universal stress UspA family protein